MKKLLLPGLINDTDDKLLVKLIRYMKLIFIFVFICSLHVSAKVYSQDRFTLTMGNVSVEKVLNKIQNESSYRFFYNAGYLEHLHKVSIKVKDEKLSDILDKLLGNNLSYHIMENNLVVISLNDNQVIQHKIEGTITDENGKPLSGVSVQVKGIIQGTMTDESGKFSMTVPENSVLSVSFVGYETQEVKVGNKTNIMLQLKVAISDLNQVVVVGYGTQKKANLTGAVSQVSGKVLDNRALPNLTQGLQGTVANLNITMLNGKPNQSPSYNVRGETSIGQGGSALVLIDGVEGDPSLVNPNDVASITVLKDASSAAIYGARGVFGVVLIITKSARKGKTSISYSSGYSFKQPTTVPDQVTNGYTYAKMFSEAYSGQYNYTQIAQNINKTQGFSQSYLDAFAKHDQDPSLPKTELNAAGEYVYYANTDWYKLLYKPHNFAADQNLSVSGGNDKASFLITGRYYDQGGIFRYNSDNYKTYNFRAKGSIQVAKFLEINNNTSFSNVGYHNPINVGESGGIWTNMSDEAHPSAPMLNPDGTLTYSGAYTVGDFYYGKNGVNLSTNVVRNTTGFIAKLFHDKVNINGDFTFQNTNFNQQQKRVPVPYSTKPGVINYLGLDANDLKERYDKINYIAANLYGQYETTVNDLHYFKALMGYNFEQSSFKRLEMQRNGLIFPDAQDINLALGQAIRTSGGWDQWDISGGFFRFNYGYNDRYLLEVNGRYDGSSKFPVKQRFGFFPSVSAGWRLSKEKFWHVSPKTISDAKIRASYGSLGNGNINSYQFLEQLGISQSYRILNGQLPQITSNPAVIPNGLTWETATTQDLGLDISFLNYRLTLTADAYVRKTTNMFTVGPTLPDVFGATVPKGNYADLKTTGGELAITWQDRFNVRSSPFHYSITVNAAHYNAVITKYNNPNKNLNDYYVGQKLGEIWGYQTDGFWTADNVGEAKKMNANVSARIPVWLPGDIKFKDLDKDGVITHGNQTVANPGDMRIIGNTTPRYTYGISLNSDWKNFFVSVFFQGTGRRDWYPNPESDAFWGTYNRPYNVALKSQLNKIWTEDNPNAYFPRLRGYVASKDNAELIVKQTRYLQNAAYIRLKNIQVGYNLPQSLVTKAKMSNARIYISGENLAVWSPMFKITAHNIDPESINGTDNIIPDGLAGDAQSYPILKSITLGLNITF